MPKKILIVDDDPTTNTLVNFLLKTKGYEAVSAGDGDEGLEIAKNENPELIILDVGMPRMDGFTFLNELKQANLATTPRVIVLTGKAQLEDVFRQEGVADFFVKPLDSDKFLKKIEECLKG